uniref:Uncharacterized protein n=1 Tax=Pipistrellus kuhlii TaxID=59472 RepID=A0A7J8A8F5_PIPKU|nr:hypothetical protein mPipKuh1_009025 [Pipistrellus kuhlii]
MCLQPAWCWGEKRMEHNRQPSGEDGPGAPLYRDRAHGGPSLLRQAPISQEERRGASPQASPLGLQQSPPSAAALPSPFFSSETLTYHPSPEGPSALPRLRGKLPSSPSSTTAPPSAPKGAFSVETLLRPLSRSLPLGA